MSGGYFEYIDSQLKSQIFGWRDKYNNVFEDKQISELVWDILSLIHEFDWYKSGDNCRETYLKAKREFKEKWLSGDDNRENTKRIIDEALNEMRQELYETFDIANDAYGGDSS